MEKLIKETKENFITDVLNHKVFGFSDTFSNAIILEIAENVFNVPPKKIFKYSISHKVKGVIFTSTYAVKFLKKSYTISERMKMIKHIARLTRD